MSRKARLPSRSRPGELRAEEALASPDHSEVAMEHWDAAGFTEQDAQTKAKKARDEYKDALRLLHYGM